MIERIKQWQMDRQLNKKPINLWTVFQQVNGEVCEAFGLDGVDTEAMYNTLLGATPREVSAGDTASELADIIVFVVGYIMQLGYDPTCILTEVVKKIESREGSYDPILNKWIKKGQGSYKPNYERCKNV